MKPTQEMITIVSDGITVTARKYVDGELTCSAECVKNPDEDYIFDRLATDAVYALRVKQDDRAVEYCKADADVTKQYYEYRKAHPDMFPEEQEDDVPECDEPDRDVQDEATKYPKIYQSVADYVEEAYIIYYEGRPEIFWEDFKQGKFTIKVSSGEWTELAVSAKPYGLKWRTGTELDGWTPPFEYTGTYTLYIGVCSFDLASVGYCHELKNFKGEVCIAWEDIKEALMTTDTSTNAVNDTPIPWKDIMDRKCIIRVGKHEWKQFAEQAAANGVLWSTGAKVSPNGNYPGYHLDVDAVYLGRLTLSEGLVWGTALEDFDIPKPTVIHFSRWCDND